MRNEQEMLTLITQTAIEDPRIRAAYLEGSRAVSYTHLDVYKRQRKDRIVCVLQL